MHAGPYDLVVLAVLGGGFVLGRAKGFAWQLSGIATLVLGYLAATAGAAVLGPFFPDAWPLDLKKFAAWVATYAIVCVAVYLVTLRLSKKIKENELEELDRRFGGALGAFKAGLFFAMISLAAIATSERAREVVKNSASGVLLARAAHAARPLLPDRIGEAVAKIAGDIAPTPTPPVAAPPPKPAPKPAPQRPAAARPLPATHRLDAPPSPPPSPPPAPPKAPATDDHEDMTEDPPEPADPLAPSPKR